VLRRLVKFRHGFCSLSHAGCDLLLLCGELYIKYNDTVNPRLDVFDGVKFFLGSMVCKAKGGVQVCNEVSAETCIGDVL
jgi:hypothetical protein